MELKKMIEARRLLLSDARKTARVTCDMVARAFRLGVPTALVWAAAGAGLADYHKRTGITVDLRHELRGCGRIPAAYFDGYNSELRAGVLADELSRTLRGA